MDETVPRPKNKSAGYSTRTSPNYVRQAMARLGFKTLAEFSSALGMSSGAASDWIKNGGPPWLPLAVSGLESQAEAANKPDDIILVALIPPVHRETVVSVLRAFGIQFKEITKKSV